MVPCLTCGTPCQGPRCPTHQHRYGRAHHTTRATWLPAVATGTTQCPRCHTPIAPHDHWQLDHIHGGLHPAHRWCNETQASPDAR